MAAANRVRVDVPQHAFDVQPRRCLEIAGYAADLSVDGLAEITLMIQVEQLAALVVVEKQSFGVEQFQRVVFRWIVRCGERDAAARVNRRNVNLDSGRWRYSYIDHFAAGGQ